MKRIINTEPYKVLTHAKIKWLKAREIHQKEGNYNFVKEIDRDIIEIETAIEIFLSNIEAFHETVNQKIADSEK